MSATGAKASAAHPLDHIQCFVKQVAEFGTVSSKQKLVSTLFSSSDVHSWGFSA
jgi:hypothetical protein